MGQGMMTDLWYLNVDEEDYNHLFSEAIERGQEEISMVCYKEDLGWVLGKNV